MGRTVQIFIVFSALLAVLTGWMWIEFRPSIPRSANQAASQPESQYATGGRQCQSPSLRAISDPVARRAKEEDCAKQRDQDRKEQSDLEQQTRSANGAEIVAALAEDDARITLLAAILSMWTTILLIWTLWETRTANRTQLRAYVGLDRIFSHPEGNLLRADHKVVVGIKNFGATPAQDVNVQIRFADAHGVPLEGEGRPNRNDYFATLPPTQIVTPGISVPFADVEAGRRRTTYWLVTWSYKDAFGERHNERALISTEPDQWRDRFVGIVSST